MGVSSGSSSHFRFSLVMAPMFHVAVGRTVPFFVLKEKHLNVLCPLLPHRQQSYLLFQHSSHFLAGTPRRVSSFVVHASFPPKNVQGLLVLVPSFFFSLLFSLPFWVLSEPSLFQPSFFFSAWLPVSRTLTPTSVLCLLGSTGNEAPCHVYSVGP